MFHHFDAPVSAKLCWQTEGKWRSELLCNCNISAFRPLWHVTWAILFACRPPRIYYAPDYFKEVLYDYWDDVNEKMREKWQDYMGKKGNQRYFKNWTPPGMEPPPAKPEPTPPKPSGSPKPPKSDPPEDKPAPKKAAPKAEEKKPEPKPEPVKEKAAEPKAEEKKPEPKPEPVKEKAPEPKAEEKKPEPKPEPVKEKAPEPKAEEKKPEPKPEPVKEKAPEPKAEEKKPEPVKEKAPEPKAEEKKPEPKPEPVKEKAAEPKAEEKKPEPKPEPVKEKAPEPKAEEKKPEPVKEKAPEPKAEEKKPEPKPEPVKEKAPEPKAEAKSAAPSAKDVKTLRERSKAGILDCKKALAETDGDMEKAMEWLKKKGMAKADKKAGNVAVEGCVASYVHFNNKIAVLVEVNSETVSWHVLAINSFKAFALLLTNIVAWNGCPIWVAGHVLSGSKDFVANNAIFKEFAADVAMQVAANDDVAYMTVDDVPAEEQEQLDAQHGEQRHDEHMIETWLLYCTVKHS